MTASAVAAPSGVAYVKAAAGLDFARVWSSIFSVAAEKPPKSILFVSPGPRQGASTLASGSALTAAVSTTSTSNREVKALTSPAIASRRSMAKGSALTRPAGMTRRLA